MLFAPYCKGNGGVSVVSPSGRTTHILAEGVLEPLRPNGIALEPEGSFLLAHLGDEKGAVIRLFADGQTELVTDEVDGHAMPPANFVTRDDIGRIWITVSTRSIPRADDYRRSASTGFIALHEDGQTSIKADNLGYANELAFSADQKTVCINETFARQTSAFDVNATGELSNKRTVASYGAGTFPDGVTYDVNGDLWITSIISNRVIHLSERGATTVIEDCEADHVAWVESAFDDHSLGRAHLDKAVSKRLRNISNLAFGGTDLKTAFLGSLLDDKIAVFQSPVPGQALPHWDVELGPLVEYLE